MRRTSLLWEVYVQRFKEALERYRKPSLAGRLAFSAAALRRRALWVAGGEDTDPDPRRYPSLQGAAAAGARSDAGVDA